MISLFRAVQCLSAGDAQDLAFRLTPVSGIAVVEFWLQPSPLEQVSMSPSGKTTVRGDGAAGVTHTYE